MSLLFKEICEKLKDVDEITLLERLHISSEEIVERFEDRVEEFLEEFEIEFKEEDDNGQYD